MPKPAFSNVATTLQTTQLANDPTTPVASNVTHGVTWVLSLLGYAGTPREQLLTALATINNLSLIHI